MINENRIVPIQSVDLLSMYGLILQQTNPTIEALETVSVEGDFEIKDGAKPLIANEPVKTIEIASGVSSATVYFVAGYDYDGFTVNGSPATIADNDVVVVPDCHTLYKAVLGSNTVTITKVGF